MVRGNLLRNAARSSPAGSEITIRIRRRDGLATVAVIDRGVGISPEDQVKLFTRFGRAQSTQHVQGTGLGLWLSREIARMHGGDLTVQSDAGTGSTFVLAVPLRQEARRRGSPGGNDLRNSPALPLVGHPGPDRSWPVAPDPSEPSVARHPHPP